VLLAHWLRLYQVDACLLTSPPVIDTMVFFLLVPIKSLSLCTDSGTVFLGFLSICTDLSTIFLGFLSLYREWSLAFVCSELSVFLTALVAFAALVALGGGCCSSSLAAQLFGSWYSSLLAVPPFFFRLRVAVFCVGAGTDWLTDLLCYFFCYLHFLLQWLFFCLMLLFHGDFKNSPHILDSSLFLPLRNFSRQII
jgi:hypothetical protein